MKKGIMTFRISDNERSIVENMAKANHMSVSQYIRHKLNIYSAGNIEIEKENMMTPEIVCNILTEIQKMRQVYPNVEFEELEGSVAKLCQ